MDCWFDVLINIAMLIFNLTTLCNVTLHMRGCVVALMLSHMRLVKALWSGYISLASYICMPQCCQPTRVGQHCLGETPQTGMPSMISSPPHSCWALSVHCWFDVHRNLAMWCFSLSTLLQCNHAHARIRGRSHVIPHASGEGTLIWVYISSLVYMYVTVLPTDACVTTLFRRNAANRHVFDRLIPSLPHSC